MAPPALIATHVSIRPIARARLALRIQRSVENTRENWELLQRSVHVSMRRVGLITTLDSELVPRTIVIGAATATARPRVSQASMQCRTRRWRPDLRHSAPISAFASLEATNVSPRRRWPPRQSRHSRPAARRPARTRPPRRRAGWAPSPHRRRCPVATGPTSTPTSGSAISMSATHSRAYSNA